MYLFSSYFHIFIVNVEASSKRFGHASNQMNSRPNLSIASPDCAGREFVLLEGLKLIRFFHGPV